VGSRSRADGTGTATRQYALAVPDPPPVSGISELVLEVSDLGRARAFYRDVLGFEETLYGEGREGRYWYLIGDSARLGLWTPQTGLAGGRGGAHVHFAFQLPRAELDGMLKRVRERGVEVEGPVQLGADRAIYVTDPDGNVVEFWTQDMGEYAAAARAGRGSRGFERPER
jgi:catechol-2,3-dioxygenase